MNRATLITCTLRAYVFAWLALLPLVGIGFAIVSFISLNRARPRESAPWNPAERYRTLAAVVLATALITHILGMSVLLRWILSLIESA